MKGQQLELFDKKEIPKELKALLCGNGENDFALGIEVAKSQGYNTIECLVIALTNFELDIPDSAEFEHHSINTKYIIFQVMECEYEDIAFALWITDPKEQHRISIAEWEETDDCFTMKKRIDSKLRAILKDNYHYFKELLK